MGRTSLTLQLSGILICGLTTCSFAQPGVPGFDVAEYASVIDPQRIDFDTSGVLFVGRDNTGSGGGPGDALKIHRIGIGGSPATEYGNSEIMDPDAVIADSTGFFGTPGAVLAGGQISNSEGGQIWTVLPNQDVVSLFGPTTDFHNPTDFVFDGLGRMLFTNASNPGLSTRGVYATTGAGNSPSLLFATSQTPIGIAIDPFGRIFVSTIDGRIEIHEPDGTLVDDSFVSGLGTAVFFAFGAFGNCDTELFVVNSVGELLRVDLSGTATVIGTGFESVTDLAFGPDGALYVSEFNNDRVLRISAVNTPGVVADSLTAFRGSYFSGDLEDTFQSDDCHLKYNPGIVLSSAEAPVWLVFDGTLPSDSPNSLAVVIEASANTVGLSQTVEMFNWTSGSYEEVDVRSATLNSDGIVNVDMSANIQEFVEAGTGSVRTRIGWRKDGIIFIFPWTISVDQVVWTTN